MIYYVFSKFLQNHHKSVLAALFTRVTDFAVTPLPLVGLLREVPGRKNRAEDGRSLSSPAGGASSSAGEVAGRDHGPVRTLWASQLGSRWLVACRPREQRSTGGCSGGDVATVAAVAGKGEPKGRRTTWKVLAHTVGLEGARGGGNAAAASLASRPWRTRVPARSGARKSK
jgi:hypothetical protein